MQDNEIWKPIPGFENIYEASNLGNIKSLGRDCKTGEYYHTVTLQERILKPSKDKDGYRRLTLSKNAIKHYKRINRLVCAAFHPNPENKPFVNHKNGIKWDDRSDNLEWSTTSENQLHSYRVLSRPLPRSAFKKGIHARGNHLGAKPIHKLDRDGNILKSYDCIMDAEDDGFTHENISKVLKGKYRTHGGFKWSYQNALT